MSMRVAPIFFLASTVLLVLAVLGFGVWLGLRTWKKRQDSH